VRRGPMKEWWGWFNNPYVKGATGCALSLFLALNFPVVFLAIVATALCYAVVPVAVACAYRKRYGIVGKSKLAVRFVRRACSASQKDAVERWRTLWRNTRDESYLSGRSKRGSGAISVSATGESTSKQEGRSRRIVIYLDCVSRTKNS
jgi:hypothetical protein